MVNLVSVIESIKTKLRSIKNSDGSDVWNIIRVWNNQYDRINSGMAEDQSPGTNIYIEINNSNTNNLLLQMNGIDLNIKFHILHWEINNYGSYDEDLTVFRYRDLLHQNIMGWTPIQCSALNYLRERQHYDHMNLYHYTIEYKTHYVDVTAYKDPNMIDIEVTKNINY